VVNHTQVRSTIDYTLYSYTIGTGTVHYRLYSMLIHLLVVNHTQNVRWEGVIFEYATWLGASGQKVSQRLSTALSAEREWGWVLGRWGRVGVYQRL
jgi:hypothetical protein